MDAMELLKAALDAWDLELKLSEDLERYYVQKKDDGRKLRIMCSPEAIQDIKAIHGINAGVDVICFLLDDVFKELCAESMGYSIVPVKPEPIPKTRTPEEVTQEVLKLFNERKELFYSDIAETLDLDFATVIKACTELEKQGKVKGI